jgi:hypothetical protein
MKTQTINTFLFSELNEKAKEFALNKYRELGISDYWYEDTYYDAKQNGIRLTGFDLDRGQKIEGEFIWSEIEVAEKLEDEFAEGTNMNNLASIFLKDRLRICDSFEFVDGAPIKEDELEAELNDLEYQFQKDVLQEYWKLLQLEYEYLFSDEFLADHFDNNECQFTENGKLFIF